MGRAPDPLRHPLDGGGARAGHRLRGRRLSRRRADGPRVARRRGETRRRSRRQGHVPARRRGPGAGPDGGESAPRREPRPHRRGRCGGVLPGPHRPGDCRRHGGPRRPAHGSGLRRPHRRVGRADQGELPRLRRARDAAVHAGRRGARDPESPRGLRHPGHGAQQRRPSARAGRGQEDRVCRSRRASCRPRGHGPPRAGDAALEGLRGASAPGHRHEEGRQLPGRPGAGRCGPAAGLLGPRPGRHHLPHGGRRRRQRDLVHPVALCQFRRRHRRRRDRHHA